MEAPAAPALTVNARGLKCPLPVLYLRRAGARLASGERLVLIADDPLASIDIPHFCAGAGFEIEEKTQEGRTLIFRIRRI